MQHIQTGLSQMGNLKVFMKTPVQTPQANKIKFVPSVKLKSEKPEGIASDR